jgi:hypothetical protein
MPVAKVKDIQARRVFLNTVNYSKSKVSTIGSFTADVKGVYPFRVRFENIGVSIPPSQGIGIAVIGSSFIIL